MYEKLCTDFFKEVVLVQRMLILCYLKQLGWDMGSTHYMVKPAQVQNETILNRTVGVALCMSFKMYE